MLGREVITLVDQAMQQGRYQAAWDGLDAGGRPVAGGVYLYRIKAGTFIDVMMMLK